MGQTCWLSIFFRTTGDQGEEGRAEKGNLHIHVYYMPSTCQTLWSWQWRVYKVEFKSLSLQVEKLRLRGKSLSEMVSVQLGFKPNSQALPQCLTTPGKANWPAPDHTAPLGRGRTRSLKPESLSGPVCTGGNCMSRVTYEQVKSCKASQSMLLFLPWLGQLHNSYWKLLHWLRHYFNSEELNTNEISCSGIQVEMLS